MGSNIIGLRPHHFVHITDLNTNVTKLELGPNTIVLQSNEKLVAGPLPCIIIPPGHYCVIKNPVCNYVHEKKCDLRLGYLDIRFHGEPFPLYPGEVLLGAKSFGASTSEVGYGTAIKPLPVVPANSAVRLKALQDFEDGDVERKAGDMWQLEGPLTYKPTPEAEMLGVIQPQVIGHNQALLLRATQGFTDKHGVDRVTGEEWLIKEPGAYLPDVYAEVVELRNASVLKENEALHLQADQTLVDAMGIKRLAGEEWLITNDDAESYIPDVGVTVKQLIDKTVLMKGQYCVVINPQDKHGHNQMGKKELRQGLCSFFLKPGESLEDGVIKQSYVMGEDEAIVLKALSEFTDTMAKSKQKRKPGDRWMMNGPLEYIPPIEVEVVDLRKAIPLNKNEGVYVRNEETGEVRSVMGPCAYMLSAYEVLWKKQLTDSVELLLKNGGGYGKEDIRKIAYFEQSIDPSILKGRDKTRVVTYRCPGNTAVQIYNYKKKTARVIFGPDLVVLGPHENFNVLSLSAGKPKKPHALHSLCLMLGPDFITDILEVETSDHARLSVKIAFNNYFKVERGKPDSEASIFNVPDFIGYACGQIGSRIRAQVAQIPFDQFHRHSAQIITAAVFGYDKDGKINDSLFFSSNSMVVTNVDIQSIEPVDVKMKDSLSKSVQMAIEISTKSIERAAAHEALRSEQIAKGRLERQKLQTEQDSEIERAKLYELRNIAAAVESTGQAKAEAQAQAEKTLIEAQSEIEAAQLKALAAKIEHEAELHMQGLLRSSELSFLKSQNELETGKAKELTNIEISKFASIVSTIGADTLAAIANSGPEMQAKLLQGLGLESMLITDGNNPINLFNTAEGLIGGN